MDFKKKIILILLGTSFIFFSQCKIFKSGNNAPEQVLVFPPAPDTARIQFLTKISSSVDIEKEQSAFSKFILGKERPSLIAKPYGIEMSKSKIYVCDVGIKGLSIIDLEKGSFDYFLPAGKGKLMIPVNCFVDKKGFLYVADSGRKEIVIFDNKGKYISSFGDSINFQPLDVFVADNKIWVANLKGHKIHVYKNDSTHQLLSSFPNVSINEKGYLFQPKNIYVTDSKVYVSDMGGFKISIFSKEGKFLSSVGNQGTRPGQFANPKGISVDKEDNLYVIDAGFANAQIFNGNNKLLLFFGGSSKGKGYMYLPASITINYENVKYFEKYVEPKYNLKYLILVTNQYGSDKINVYGRIELKDK